MIKRKRSGIAGWGVFATTTIPKNKRIIDYAGERITHQESLKREERYLRKGNIWCFTLNRRWVIDAGVGGNIARFINHSCDPNCIAWIEGKHIWIDALRDIKQGEELGYEYEYDFDPEYTIEDLEFYGCKCGSPRCRGTIVDVPKSKSHLIRELRRRMRERERPGRRTARKSA